MKVIGFCGLPGSGKSTALESVNDLGVVVNMGDVIRNEAIKKNIEITDENLGYLAKTMRIHGGDDIIAKECVNLIEGTPSDVIFVDGIRSSDELDVFRKHWKFPLVFIKTDDKNRYQRIKERARKDDSNSVFDIKKREEREIGFGLLELIQRADYIVNNNSTIKDLKRRIRKLIKKLIKNYSSL
ncbi:MAG: dephospho-CoA kinase [Promethearchaeota archaeon]|nr:MAG: dephospho-CoA kinase [Candidatus Lokiarchaeota archaeon]